MPRSKPPEFGVWPDEFIEAGQLPAQKDPQKRPRGRLPQGTSPHKKKDEPTSRAFISPNDFSDSAPTEDEILARIDDEKGGGMEKTNDFYKKLKKRFESADGRFQERTDDQQVVAKLQKAAIEVHHPRLRRAVYEMFLGSADLFDVIDRRWENAKSLEYYRHQIGSFEGYFFERAGDIKKALPRRELIHLYNNVYVPLCKLVDLAYDAGRFKRFLDEHATENPKKLPRRFIKKRRG